MKSTSVGVEKLQHTGLEHLSDTELLEYKKLIDNLSVRELDILKNKIDTKFSYHVVRLALEAEQILQEHSLDLERNRELLKSIRRGEWSSDKLKQWFSNKEDSLESLYNTSSLRHSPDEEAIRNLLLQSLEAHYGTISNAVEKPKDIQLLVESLDAVLSNYR